MTLILAIAGAFLGGAMGGAAGVVGGGLLGLLLSWMLEGRAKLDELKEEHEKLKRELAGLRLDLKGRLERTERVAEKAFERSQGDNGDRPRESAPQAIQERPSLAATSAVTKDAGPAAEPERTVLPALVAAEPAASVPAALASLARQPDLVPEATAVAPGPGPWPFDEPPASRPVEQSYWSEPSAPDFIERGVNALKTFFLGGNTVVRVGILVLLVGVVLLLRWTAEHAVLPIELRLSGAAALAAVLVAVGYRQRSARPGFAQTLQGGGIAALYLVTFFAFRSYQLLPSGLTFALLIAVALSSGVLAVAQDALSLIVIGQVGGFMAPVLASSGGGSHVALFSYYLLLNLLVLGVAFFKAWRALNLIGFFFTFGVGTAWGALRYRAEDFAATEPFLIAFFLLYVAIPVLFTLKRPLAQRGWVDASLVFGTPLATILLQYALVKDKPFGMAYTALAMGAFYVVLGRTILRRAPVAGRSLVEALLALGVGFTTLAVPYGFDNHNLTGATWALEGAGLYWLGVRQQRWLSRLGGATLELLAALALTVEAATISARPEALPWVNTQVLAALLVCSGCLFVARHAHAHRATLRPWEWRSLQALIAVGLVFWLARVDVEVERHIPAELTAGTTLALVAGTALVLELIGHKLAWLPGRVPGVLLLCLLGPILLGWESDLDVHPLGHGGAWGWPLCFLVSVLVLRRFVPDAEHERASLLHAVCLWWAVLFAWLEAWHLTRDHAGLSDDWAAAAVGVVLAGAIAGTGRATRGERWPFAVFPELYLRVGLTPVVVAGCFWSLWSDVSCSGHAAPLPYFPLLNSLDLAHLSWFVAVLDWSKRVRKEGGWLNDFPLLFAAIAVAWLNAVIARSVHQYAGVPFALERLWQSAVMQAALSVCWSLLGMVAAVVASRRQLRTLWILGAVVLGLVVIKLFLVDLAQLRSEVKIVTFLAVGGLLVLVGYIAPVPPAKGEQGESA